MKSNTNLTHVPIPTRSQYDQYLDAALKTSDGQAISVPVATVPASMVSNLNQLIRRRGVPVRVIRRGEQVFVARRGN